MEGRLAVNFDMITSEVLWTDRDYSGRTAEFRQYLFGGEAPSGDRYPTFALTWPPSPRGAGACARVPPIGAARRGVKLWRSKK